MLPGGSPSLSHVMPGKGFLDLTRSNAMRLSNGLSSESKTFRNRSLNSEGELRVSRIELGGACVCTSGVDHCRWVTSTMAPATGFKASVVAGLGLWQPNVSFEVEWFFT